jgi:hypothetical protein
MYDPVLFAEKFQLATQSLKNSNRAAGFAVLNWNGICWIINAVR